MLLVQLMSRLKPSRDGGFAIAETRLWNQLLHICAAEFVQFFTISPVKSFLWFQFEFNQACLVALSCC